MKAIVIDANIFCLVVAGYFSPKSIGRHKRLKIFDITDFERVQEILSVFSRVVTCPHVLAETSNLLRQAHDAEQKILMMGMRKLLEQVEEVTVLSRLASEHDDFLRLGLTDAVLLTMEAADAPLLTTDIDLTLAAQKSGGQVINYNWFRDGAVTLSDHGM